MYKILLIEDDAPLGKAMKEQLEAYDNEVTLVKDFKNVMAKFAEAKPHLVLMDIMLPHGDGYKWCAEIRRVSNVPVVFISSASENMNIVMAINMGGDDFIPKPVDPMVLTAKVSAVLRRTYELSGDGELRSFSGAVLNVSNGTVVNGDKTAELTKNELRILELLLLNKGKIVSRSAIMLKLWQNDLYVEENTLSVNVGRLRKKLESIGLPDIIETKAGSGYVIK